MERKIGETFKVGDKFVKVVEETFGCNGCAFFIQDGLCGMMDGDSTYCTPDKREDGKGVIFKIVEEKDMEERVIRLTLERARALCKEGGAVKDLLLTAFKEFELKGVPNTWEEFCKDYPTRKGEVSFFSENEQWKVCEGGEPRKMYLLPSIPSIDAAKAHIALMKLHQLRDCYRQGWEPTFKEHNYAISHNMDYKLSVFYNDAPIHFLSFPTKEMANMFLNNFRDIIKQAGDLI